MLIFEFMTVFVGYFKNNSETAAHVIITNIFIIMGSVYIGFSSFMSTRIGNLVGENNPGEIKVLLEKAVKLSLLIVYALYLILVIFQDPIIHFYSNDPEVARHIKPIIKLYCFL